MVHFFEWNGELGVIVTLCGAVAAFQWRPDCGPVGFEFLLALHVDIALDCGSLHGYLEKLAWSEEEGFMCAPGACVGVL